MADISRAISMHEVEKLAEVLGRSATAARTTAVLMDDAEFSEGLTTGAVQLDKIAGALESGVKVHKNASAVIGLYKAWNAIDSGSVRSNPQQAARAFGSLFRHAGTIGEQLPFPAPMAAALLKETGDFFENMRDKMDPESPNTPRGRMFRQAFPGGLEN